MATFLNDNIEGVKLLREGLALLETDLKGIISSVVADWCTEIRRALDFFYSTYPDDQINKIYLSGGGANIAEFRELLAVEASAEVEAINPFRGCYIDDERFDSEKGVKFITYAVWWVRQATIHALSDQSGAFRLPQKQVVAQTDALQTPQNLRHSTERSKTSPILIWSDTCLGTCATSQMCRLIWAN